MKVLILGSGYIGKALFHYWKKQGLLDVTVTTTSKQKQQSLQKEGIPSIVFDSNTCSSSIEQHLLQADKIVIAIAPKKGFSYQQTYLQTAQSICSFFEKENCCKQIVYLSSTSVYGEQNGNWVVETTPCIPGTENAQILIDTEQLYLKYPSTILRLAGIYGPKRSHQDRIARLAGREMAGTGKEFCNWVHQQDIISAIDWVIKRNLLGIYNICSDDHPTKKELYKDSVQWNPFIRNTHSGNKRVSNKKMRQTGFTFQHSCL